MNISSPNHAGRHYFLSCRKTDEAFKKDISVLKSLIAYDPESGLFSNLIERSSNSKARRVLGTKSKNGYLVIRVQGRLFYAHRLAWIFFECEKPKGLIDHINGIKTDNRIRNLRVTNKSVNGQNVRKARSTNRSGFLGVSTRGPETYTAEIWRLGKRMYLGTFSCPVAAHRAYVSAKRKLHEGNTL